MARVFGLFYVFLRTPLFEQQKDRGQLAMADFHLVIVLV